MRTRSATAIVLAAVALGLVGLAACRRAEVPAGTAVHTLQAGGEQRSYRLYVPPRLATPAALVLMLHGGFGTAEHAEEHYGWDAVARERGFVVAYPDGLGRAWNAGGGCCGRSGSSGVDDVGFLTEVVADVERRVAVDPARVFATGMSNGGIMSYRLACDSTVFAAIAPVAATMLGDCPAPTPVSLLHIHGLADGSVAFDGSPGTGVARIDGPDIPSLMDTWRAVDDCPPPRIGIEGKVTTVRSECPQGREVALVTVAGAGHQWPGSTVSRGQEILGADPPSTAFDATAMIAEFFLAHPRR